MVKSHKKGEMPKEIVVKEECAIQSKQLKEASCYPIKGWW
jgi:hypothetical protein